jgi:release factor glutamine methyltransferase
MSEWHPLPSSKITDVSASWNELNRKAEERGRSCDTAQIPSLNHASRKDYEEVYQPSDDTYLLLDGLLLDDWDAISTPSTTLHILEIGTGSGVPIIFLAKQLAGRGHCVHAMATDINPKALEFAGKTAIEHEVTVEWIPCDLATPLLEDYTGKIHVILFNPPYVPTPDEEMVGNGIEVSWAGGEKGRRVIDRALPQISQLMARPNGICYMITVDDNEPEDISNVLSSQYDLTMTPLVRRRAHNECLTLQKITTACEGIDRQKATKTG